MFSSQGERDRRRLVEDTGFGTEMMGKGRERPRARGRSLASGFPLSATSTLVESSFLSLLLVPFLSASLEFSLSFSLSPSLSAVSVAASPLVVTPSASLIFLPGLGPRLVN